ncbi:hypothetical protein SBF1_2370014 [Candidatus Desulfosporosinus infrequens]|uniref:Uncharacterized protein n=1 Tax=Candidatus Desulfosporosinus infrequens TaxID=2043169 RepID=A0A2U3KMK4_9FIRM|nr:hypothetical protein SBF1_2370014 [Candidatus Desulfosporosinus infrequens]
MKKCGFRGILVLHFISPYSWIWTRTTPSLIIRLFYVKIQVFMLNTTAFKRITSYIEAVYNLTNGHQFYATLVIINIRIFRRGE